ncbi:transcription factor GTE9-like isoform X2 [Cucumis melo var. makuwa]|uniref:Transcription factor GTE9-like isoform X2 n=1 Tax=Cucumis melo var. makuwa TaxID=1194695 RepID=A0A5D3CTY1_CUCMM|nr:transcription factor GTE9-like isoform X2 [Cucumis melo var. makuwa]TYK15353.1 transcription factor GTE9-like isoform X2 [Cucumis melo var. makuwa]
MRPMSIFMHNNLFHYKKSGFSRRRKTSREVKNTSRKDLQTQFSTSGAMSRDRLFRRCVGHASGKPLSIPSFPMQSTASGKPRLLFRCHVLRRESLPDRLYRAALLRNSFTNTILKARKKHLKRMEREELERQQREGWSLYIDDSTIIVEKVERSKLFHEVTHSFFNTEKALLQAEAKVTEDARRKAEAEVAAAARDGNDDGTDGDECFSLLRTLSLSFSVLCKTETK